VIAVGYHHFRGPCCLHLQGEDGGITIFKQQQRRTEIWDMNRTATVLFVFSCLLRINSEIFYNIIMTSPLPVSVVISQFAITY
jgi:hypothetical protein